MALSLNTLKVSKGKHKGAKRVGRGWSTGRGKYSSRGVKGQKSRSGGRGGLKLKGLKAQIARIPKISHFKSLKPKLATVTLEVLEKNFKSGEKVTATVLTEKGIIRTAVNGLKVVGNTPLTKKLTVVAQKASAQAIEGITKAGGTIKVTDRRRKKRPEGK